MLGELDVEAESRALRILQDAEKHGGLLEKAVKQLHANCRKAGRQAGSTWFGRLRKRVRKVWPNFRVDVDPTLSLIGIPEDGKLARKYILAQWQRHWRIRQEGLMRIRPQENRQDYLLYSIIRKLIDPESDGSTVWLTEAIFPTLNTLGHEHLQTFLRFLNGMADFARVNAHEPRWTAFPGLRESALKRACLFCHKAGKQRSTDTEWHALFQCVECRKPRNRFRLALRSFPK